MLRQHTGYLACNASTIGKPSLRSALVRKTHMQPKHISFKVLCPLMDNCSSADGRETPFNNPGNPYPPPPSKLSVLL